ncbi:MAG: hypothetical protein GHCLOJNM_00664 [bacterium]|nr:hypothetical protein [bacterium]
MGIHEPLEPLKRADLPPRTAPFWRLAGPGAVLVGLSIGAGEIVIWPRMVAQHGGGMIWAAGVGVFLQMWINFEVGRWTIATGETVYTGYCRVWRGFALFFIAFNILGWLAPGWGRTSGLALKALLVGPDGWGSDTTWTVLTFFAVAALLFGPKKIYRSVEWSIEALVVIITASLLVLAFAVGTLSALGEMASGLVNFGYKPPGMTVKELFIAIVFAGAGGTANLFYTFYLRDKHIGMGALVPSLVNPLRGKVEAVPSTGYRFPDTPENRTAFRSWWQYVVSDQMLFFWGLNSITILLFIFGSLAVLHPRGIVPSQGTLIWDMASLLGEVWGPAGRTLFLVVGVATLFSTQLTLVDGVSRSIADIVYTNYVGAKKRPLAWWYLVVASVWMVVGCGITYVMEKRGVSELGFLFNAAYMGGFAMAVYTPLTLYMNHRLLPKCARPGPICTLMLIVASILYIGFAAACLYWEVMG